MEKYFRSAPELLGSLVEQDALSLSEELVSVEANKLLIRPIGSNIVVSVELEHTDDRNMFRVKLEDIMMFKYLYNVAVCYDELVALIASLRGEDCDRHDYVYRRIIAALPNLPTAQVLYGLTWDYSHMMQALAKGGLNISERRVIGDSCVISTDIKVLVNEYSIICTERRMLEYGNDTPDSGMSSFREDFDVVIWEDGLERAIAVLDKIRAIVYKK